MCRGNVMLHQRDYAKMFLLFLEKRPIGVLSFNQIEPQNKTAYIGYWIDEDHRGRGICPTPASLYPPLCPQRAGAPVCNQMSVANTRSNRALRNGFVLEGCPARPSI